MGEFRDGDKVTIDADGKGGFTFPAGGLDPSPAAVPGFLET
jgi:hypothetical protein